MTSKQSAKIAIVGVGNCASSLLQGIEHYTRHEQTAEGLMRSRIGRYAAKDIAVVAAFDVDRRKVGTPLEEAVFAPPNCTTVFQRQLPRYGVVVQMGPVLDGVAPHMEDYPQDQSFRVSDVEPVDLVDALKTSEADILVCFLPVGADRAAAEYAHACLEAGVSMVNCVPSRIASHLPLSSAFRARGLPLIGDDIKSQCGATIIHRTLVRMLADRGVSIDNTYQLNMGGNTDFLNMLDRSRLSVKRFSKTEAVQSQLNRRMPADRLHIGPSDWVPSQKDNKVCFLRIDASGFGSLPLNVELRLSVEDSANSAAVVIDAIRYAKLALDRGIGGPLEAVSAWCMKLPPKQMNERDALAEIEAQFHRE